MSMDYWELMRHYGVPPRVVRALRECYELPDPWPVNNPPAKVPKKLHPFLAPRLSDSDSTNGIYVHGPPGTGKSTWAAWVLALYLRPHTRLGDARIAMSRLDPDWKSYDPNYEPRSAPLHAERPVLYVRVPELMQKMKADFDSSGSLGRQLFEACLHAEFLVLDDLTAVPSNWELNQLDHLIDTRYAGLGRTVITSNHNFDDLEATLQSSRVASRLVEMCQEKQMNKLRR